MKSSVHRVSFFSEPASARIFGVGIAAPALCHVEVLMTSREFFGTLTFAAAHQLRRVVLQVRYLLLVRRFR